MSNYIRYGSRAAESRGLGGAGSLGDFQTRTVAQGPGSILRQYEITGLGATPGSSEKFLLFLAALGLGWWLFGEKLGLRKNPPRRAKIPVSTIRKMKLSQLKDILKHGNVDTKTRAEILSEIGMLEYWKKSE